MKSNSRKSYQYTIKQLLANKMLNRYDKAAIQKWHRITIEK